MFTLTMVNFRYNCVSTSHMKIYHLEVYGLALIEEHTNHTTMRARLYLSSKVIFYTLISEQVHDLSIISIPRHKPVGLRSYRAQLGSWNDEY